MYKIESENYPKKYRGKYENKDEKVALWRGKI